MRRLLWLSHLREVRFHPLLYALCVLGIGIGVAVVIAVDLANSSAIRAFEASAQSLAGESTHQVLGGSEGLPEEVYRDLRVGRFRVPMAPVVEGWIQVELEGAESRTVRLMGVDALAEKEFRDSINEGARGLLGEMLVGERSALVGPELHATSGGAGTIDIIVDGRSDTLSVLAPLDAGDSWKATALNELVVVDVATAQEILSMVRRLSRIDLRLTLEEEATVRDQLPEGTQLLSVDARREALKSMTDAFRANLEALGLLALLVGMFLVYQTASFSVVRRRRALGTQRVLGATRKEVFSALLVEAFWIGVIGTGLGVALGVGLAYQLIPLVARTINDLYFVLEVSRLSLDPFTMVKGIGLGVLGTVLSASRPAWEAVTRPPQEALQRSSLERAQRERSHRGTLLGLGLLGGSLVLLVFAPQETSIAFAALFVGVIGGAMLIPLVIRTVVILANPLVTPLGFPSRMALRGLVRSLSRTKVAIASLAIAISVTVGIQIMVESFRTAVVHWLEMTLPAEVYVSPPRRMSNRSDGVMSEAFLASVLARPEVIGRSLFRHLDVETDKGALRVVAADLHSANREAYQWIASSSDVWADFESPGNVVISEPLASRRQLDVGMVIELPTDHGARSFEVRGIFRDYGSEQGALMMSRAVFEASFEDRRTTSAGLFLRAGTDPEAFVQALRQSEPEAGRWNLRSQTTLRESALTVFDRTFTITSVLRWLAVIVAFVGVWSSLMALSLERVREIGLMRALGMTPRQVMRMMTLQNGMMGVLAGLLALPLGLGFAAVLIHVIHRASFGWTLEMTVRGTVLVEAVALALIAAVVAGIFPSRSMAYARPGESLREE